MEKSRECIPLITELYDLYIKIFPLPKDKNLDRKNLSKTKKYDAITNKIGYRVNINKKFSFNSNIKPLSLALLFSKKTLHDRMTQLFLFCPDFNQLSSLCELRVFDLYGQISCFFDYIELELKKLRRFYIFKPEKNQPYVIDEIIEKIIVPQVGYFLKKIILDINVLFPSNEKNTNNYFILKHIEDILKLIVKNDFNFTVAHKDNLKDIIENELKIKLSACDFYKKFGNKEDKYFPTVQSMTEWIKEYLINECEIANKEDIIYKIKSQHLIFYIFRNIYKQMPDSQNRYQFKNLIVDLIFYFNYDLPSEKITKLSLKDLSRSDFNDPLQYSMSHMHKTPMQNYLYSRIVLLLNNADYFNCFYKDEYLQDNNFTYYPDHDIYKTLNFLTNKNIPLRLLDYLKFGIDELGSHYQIDEIINLFKNNDSSIGMNIIYLFTESIKSYVTGDMKSAKIKIKEAYNRIDEYPIGNQFYQNIFAFYLGICGIKKKKPNEFTKKINYIANYCRRSFASSETLFEYNILPNRKELKLTHVENVSIFKIMLIYNQFCIDFKLDQNLLFNPFTEIEEFNRFIIGIKYKKFFNVKIESLNDIIEYINSESDDNFFNKYKEINKSPKVDFTFDSINDFYKNRLFYQEIIEELGLTEILISTKEILFLPESNSL